MPRYDQRLTDQSMLDWLASDVQNGWAMNVGRKLRYVPMQSGNWSAAKTFAGANDFYDTATSFDAIMNDETDLELEITGDPGNDVNVVVAGWDASGKFITENLFLGDTLTADIPVLRPFQFLPHTNAIAVLGTATNANLMELQEVGNNNSLAHIPAAGLTQNLNSVFYIPPGGIMRIHFCSFTEADSVNGVGHIYATPEGDLDGTAVPLYAGGLLFTTGTLNAGATASETLLAARPGTSDTAAPVLVYGGQVGRIVYPYVTTAGATAMTYILRFDFFADFQPNYLTHALNVVNGYSAEYQETNVLWGP